MRDHGSETEPRVLLELGEITRLKLNRPVQANALDWEMGEQFEAAVARVASNSEVRVLVLTAAGAHFCSGGDFSFIEENTRLGQAQVEARMLRFYQMFLGLVDLPVPTVAVLQGSAIGAGLCLALACDVRIGSTQARFGLNFVRIGLHPGMGASALVPHAVGATHAAELLLLGQTVNAEKAARLGLLSEAVSPEDLAAAGEHAALSLAAAAPLALRETVETLRRPLRAHLARALSREAACQAVDFGTEDVKRAIEAFRRKETPVFVGH
jgi:enoyl-CoA hydratase/carnithine racemase